MASEERKLQYASDLSGGANAMPMGEGSALISGDTRSAGASHPTNIKIPALEPEEVVVDGGSGEGEPGVICGGYISLPRGWRSEAWSWVGIAAPVSAASLGRIILETTDTAFLGRLGVN